MAEPELAVGDRVRVFDYMALCPPVSVLRRNSSYWTTSVGVITDMGADDALVEFEDRAYWYVRENVRRLSAIELLAEVIDG